jgi:hypothetical protein
VRIGVAACLLERLQRVGSRVEAQIIDLRLVVLEPLRLGRALEHDHGLSIDVVELLDRAVLGDEHVAAAPAVGLREVDDAGALGRDAERRDQDVDLLAVELRDAVLGGDAGQFDLVG